MQQIVQTSQLNVKSLTEQLQIVLNDREFYCNKVNELEHLLTNNPPEQRHSRHPEPQSPTLEIRSHLSTTEQERQPPTVELSETI